MVPGGAGVVTKLPKDCGLLAENAGVIGRDIGVAMAQRVLIRR